MYRIDFHSHILPGMDDGAGSAEISMKMLKTEKKDKIDKIVLTSHFYRHKENISSFLRRREKAFDALTQAVEEDPCGISFALGAEVYFYPSLATDPDLTKLCIEDTDYILLELPFEHFYDNFFIDFAAFMNRCPCRVILAHIERYLGFGNTVKELSKLTSFGDLTFQMNCASIVDSGFFKQKKMLDLISSGFIQLLGTDAHNTDTRPPLFGKAEAIITKKCGEDAFRRICRNGEFIFGD